MKDDILEFLEGKGWTGHEAVAKHLRSLPDRTHHGIGCIGALSEKRAREIASYACKALCLNGPLEMNKKGQFRKRW